MINEMKINSQQMFYNSSKTPILPLYSSYSSLPSSLPSSFSFINSVLEYIPKEESKSIDNTGVPAFSSDNNSSNISTNIPLFYKSSNSIKIPTKVEYALRRHTPKKLLKEVHPDIDVAVEWCLLFTTQLTSTFFEMQEDSSFNGYKALRAEYLRDFLGNSSLTYKNVRTALEYEFKTGAIINCDYKRVLGSKCFHYKLNEAYIAKGLVSYELKTAEAKRLLNRNNTRIYEAALQNPICRNLDHIIPTITLPNDEEINARARQLIKEEYTKKKKRLLYLNKQSKANFGNKKELAKLTFVEDAIKRFHDLTDNGLLIPTIGSAKSGGRIVDSFTLMPSWIRSMIKIDGEAIVECDYICLHPNIAIKLFGGNLEYINHKALGLVSGIEEKVVKLEHLSFFNRHPEEMKKSLLYEYYMQQEPEMMQRIINEKYQSDYKYKITSRKLFAQEVEVMTDVIKQLNKEGIYVIYVYDALCCHPKYADRVKEVMNKIILQHGIKTTAKLSTDKKPDLTIEESR